MTTTFAEITTMRVGGPIGRYEIAASTAELIDLIRAADADQQPLMVLGGGSNLIVGDIGWDGVAIKVASTGLRIDGDLVTVDAGADWDRLVRTTVDEGLAGLEALSGIPGSAGGTPVQNVGAYGSLTSDVLDSLSVYDRQTGTIERWTADRCGFGPHRTSVFKRSDRWIVIDITYRLRNSSQSKSIEYADLANKLGIAVGETAQIDDVRQAVLDIRRSRKMVLDAGDHDTWSVGSFFVNPVLAEVPVQASESPQYFDVNGTKLSAAWLIHHAGFPPGYGTDWGNGTVALSSRHALAITNRGGASTADVMKFAAHIREGVEARFGVRLNPEVDLINCSF